MNFLNGQWSIAKYGSADANTSLAELSADTGANWVALTYCHFQPSVDSPGPIYPRKTSPTDAQLAAGVAAARATNVSVFFRPCVDPDWSLPASHNTWRGQIGRHFNASDWDEWFLAYDAFIVPQAQLASRLGVELFAVGLEYVVPSQQAAHWRRTVAKIRAAAPGLRLTYCANHGNEHHVAWWDAVDDIAVDAYYSLAPNEQAPSRAALVAAWAPITAHLAALSRANGNKSVTFAEIGYCSVTGANNDPAHCGGGHTLNATAQTVLYEAFFEAVYPQPWFAGVFWWSWSTAATGGGPTDEGFSPRGKPAAAVLKRHYQ